MDVSANRRATKWTFTEQAGRLLWDLAHPLFAFSPRQAWVWRRAMLRVFGARVGAHVHIYPSVRIAIPWNLDIEAFAAVGDRAILYSLGHIRICASATVSQGAHLCAGSHDYNNPARPLTKPPITIGANTWICADAFVGPGVTIGNNSIIGARAVVMRDVTNGVIVAGNPAREISKLD